jgi:hypothetical protein
LFSAFDETGRLIGAPTPDHTDHKTKTDTTMHTTTTHQGRQTETTDTIGHYVRNVRSYDGKVTQTSYWSVDDNGSYTPISRLAFLAATDALSNSVTPPDSSHAAGPLRRVVEKRNTARLSKSRAVLYP